MLKLVDRDSTASNRRPARETIWNAAWTAGTCSEIGGLYSALGEIGSRLLEAMFQQFLTRLLQMLGGLVLAALGDGDEQSID